MNWRRVINFLSVFFVLAAVYPLVPPIGGRDLNEWFNLTGIPLGQQLTTLFIYAILALGLNVVVGYTGLLHLGIAAFFGIGVYITAIVTVAAYPFQWGMIVALVLSMVGTALLGLLLGAPTLRLRGDYLAIVTLGFGEVVRFTLRNLEEITAGKRGLNPIPSRLLPGRVSSLLDGHHLPAAWKSDYRFEYYLALGVLLVVVLLLRNLERSRLGRAWVAVREDELAASCMGISPARVKLSAFALGSAIAGLAGCLYAVSLNSTADPDSYDFNRSIIMLCCIILGGLASLRGTLLGVLLLIGFDSILAPALDNWVQRMNINPNGNVLLTFTNWKLLIFGVALILMMRFRPEGLLPSVRLKRELHGEHAKPETPLEIA